MACHCCEQHAAVIRAGRLLTNRSMKTSAAAWWMPSDTLLIRRIG